MANGTTTTTRNTNSNNNRNNGSNGSSFTVFQVPPAAAVIPSSRGGTAYGNTSIASTLSSSASFEDSPPRGFQMGWSGDYGYSASTLDNTGVHAPLPSSSSSSSAMGGNDLYAPLDESYYTYSSRGGQRGSITSTSQLASGISVSTISGFTSTDLDALEPRGGIGWMRTGRVIRVKDTGESFRFPLEDDHLPRVALTPEQYATLKRRAVLLAETAIGSRHVWMENPTLSPELKKQSWKVHLEKKNCVIYRQRGSDSKVAQSRHALVRAKLDCTLDELAYALNCDNTEDQRTLMAHCYQESFLDSAVLHVAETASFDDPFQFLGVKWLAFQSSVDAVYAVRDLLVLECCKTFTDASGQRILARVSQSINLQDYHGTERHFGFVRTRGAWIHLFRSMGPGSGMVDASLTFDMQFTGKTTPAWFANRIISGLYSVTSSLSTAADAKYIVKSRLITDKAWVPNHERPACSVCFKSFNLLRSRHHCRVCAEIMCSSCTMELTVLSSKLPPALQPETGTSLITSIEKFCLKCINKCRHDRRNALLAVRETQSVLTAAAANGSASGAYEVTDYGRQSDVHYDERHSLSDVHSEPFPPPSAQRAGAHATRSLSGDANGGSGINYYGWSSQVQGTSKPSASMDDELKIANLVGLTLNPPAASSAHPQTAHRRTDSVRSRSRLSNANERRRQGSDASVGSSFSDSSGGSEPRWERREKETSAHSSSSSGMILLEEADEAVNVVEPIPTSFVKMEESIAAQQALLRSMIIEGQKMMQSQSARAAQQQYQQPPPSAYRAPPPPQNEFIALETQSRLALPPSTAAAESSTAK